MNLGTNQSLLIALGVTYSVIFCVIAATRPRWALALSFGLAPIQRALPELPVKMTLADFNMILTFGVFVVKQLITGKRIRWGPLAVPVLIYLAICGVASISPGHGDIAITAYVQMIPYFLCSVILFSSYGRSLDDLKPAVFLLLLVGLFFGISTVAAFTPDVYNMNKNGMGSSLSCVLIVAVDLWLSTTDLRWKRFFLFCVVVVAAALLITLSRGAWMGATTGLMTILLIRGNAKIALRTAVVLIPLVVVGWFVLPDDDRSHVTDLSVKSDNIRLRLEFINNAWARFQREPLIGSGVEYRKEYDATNVVLMALAESGVLGLLAFLYLHFVVLRMAFKARHGLDPQSWSMFCCATGAALIVAHFVHGLVDHYWSRGSLSLAWAGAGMVTRAYYESQSAAISTLVKNAPALVVSRLPRRQRQRPRRAPGSWNGPIPDPPPQP